MAHPGRLISQADLVDSAAFAAYLDDLLTGEGYWEGEVVLMPKNLCVAALSLFQNLIEELDPSPMPTSLVAATVRLNNLVRAMVNAQEQPRSPPSSLCRAGMVDHGWVTGDEALQTLASRLQADFRSRFPSLVVRVVGREDGNAIEVSEGPSWGAVTTSVMSDDELSEVEVERLIAEVATDVADKLWPDEMTEPWPACPRHRDHPLQPRLVRGQASWVCWQDNSIAPTIGSLTAL